MIKNIIETLFNTIILDIKNILGDFAILTIIVGGNIIYAFFYPSPYLNDFIVKQKIAVVDDDKTSLSRDFVFASSASPNINVSFITDFQDSINLLAKQQINGILYIPDGFERDVIKSSIPKVYYMADNSYFFIHSTIIEGLAQSSDFLTDKIWATKALYNDNTINDKSDNIINWDFIPLYNESVGYLNYIVPVILIFILHQTLIMSCGILCGKQNEQFHIGNKGYFCLANPLYIVISRVIAFCIVYIPIFIFYFGYIYSLYNLNSVANALEIILFGLGFLVATSSFGIFIGSLFNKREFLPQIVLVMSMPLLFAIGFVWPVEMIPDAIKFFMWFIPISPAVSGFLSLNQMGADFNMSSSYLYHLVCLSLIYITLSYVSLKIRFYN